MSDPLAEVLERTDHSWEHGDGEEDLWVVMARAAREHIAGEIDRRQYNGPIESDYDDGYNDGMEYAEDIARGQA
jgi:hypothetical protein